MHLIMFFSSHLIEHFSHHEIDYILKEWIRVLKPNGIFESDAQI
jgi:predicted SAM-dependent methyltransferase